MMYPELIFVFIFFLITAYFIYTIIKYRKQRKIRTLLIKTISSILIIGFSFIWFMPIHIGQIGESQLCKFRFKIYSYYFHDYGGYGTFKDLFFKIMPNKYGDMDFITEQGGIKEYFGMKPLKKKTK